DCLVAACVHAGSVRRAHPPTSTTKRIILIVPPRIAGSQPGARAILIGIVMLQRRLTAFVLFLVGCIAGAPIATRHDLDAPCSSNLRSDPRNCGACGNACASMFVCSVGECKGSCDPGLTNCSSSCVDLSSS